jgi:hypothetical protein
MKTQLIICEATQMMVGTTEISSADFSAVYKDQQLSSWNPFSRK